MSWDINGKVFVKGKCLFDANFNKLKNIAGGGFNLTLIYTDPVRTSDEEIKLYQKGLEDYELKDIDYNVYDFNSIMSGLKIIKEKYDESKEKYNKLESIRYSKDYYSLNDEERDRFLEDVSFAEEDVKELEYQVDSFNYARDVMILASEIFDPDHFEYNDIEDVRLFIYAS